MDKPKFKVGDSVKVVNILPRSTGYYSNGDVGIIKQYDVNNAKHGSQPYNVDFNFLGNHNVTGVGVFWAYENELEFIVTHHTITELKKSIKNPPTQSEEESELASLILG
jgi:hypothetical protein